MNVSYQYNKRAGKSIRLLSFTCNECGEESIVVFKGSGKYPCSNCGWKIELIKESVQVGSRPPQIVSETLKQSKPYKLPANKRKGLKTQL